MRRACMWKVGNSAQEYTSQTGYISPECDGQIVD